MLHILYENEEWRPALESALDEARISHRFWSLVSPAFVLSEPPPDGVYWSRMSASAGERGQAAALDVAAEILPWLESHGRTVINGSRALALERSKLKQYAALTEAGIEVPRTVGAAGADELDKAARQLEVAPFIVKPDCGGKGAGVRHFDSADDLDTALAAGDYRGANGRWLVQEYVAAPTRSITRCEFVGGKFLYAVEVDASGGFELCPADVCDIGEAPKFRIIDGFDSPVIGLYEEFLSRDGISVAGVEHLAGEDGVPLTYDVNVNTNYNSEAEAAAGRPGAGMAAVVSYLSDLLSDL